ncbi:hypothetical protein [Aneurinibacillus aneurinilyticus]|uniref:Uncharacterized protein n=1 Tax=Aneurinibacillus aneurinilyticus ATCC 12856 TaxID=649747 RepID=U1YEF3_ANEAE|nr:hypothetical protein [Aneurinibacillus aneurinilyticus]ERI10472.1 hypothetical protein HMPREF0083_01378 [Aneurinibacillus aneurinilyticus ATCC 12856]MED0669531.1 hypothetical protein [Aneurinibacillus aneurinilyticus]MED0709099.1 hypothetical protein [Aneurinibacillus aneurinilyticus]MED0725493.1 hypothetical protein [Aneurinibacillus aneurinilyticus]MED0730804.1 hypothetical protein [Aneurinibacillus aneurinilyticus]
MSIMNMIGEGLLYIVALPIFAFQSVEALQALVEISGEISNLGKF